VSVSWSKLTAAWALCALACWGQGLDLERARRAPPAAGLAAIESALAGELAPAERDAARLLRAELLVALSRLDDGQRAYRELLEEGLDVSRELLRLAGAELELRAPAHVTAGAGAAVELRGRATGPLGLRLYRVDPARWRSEASERGLGARLRAPPRASLSRVQVWSLDPLDDGAHTVSLPALDPGLYLLAATCRDVRMTRALFVADVALGVERDADGVRLATWSLATHTPLSDVAWTLLDADARALETLDPGGALVRFREPAARAVFAWVGGAPVWRSLPPAVARPEPAPSLTPELARYRPGQSLRVEVRHGVAFRPLRLLAPSGAELQSELVRPAEGGVSVARLRLPPYAPAGRYTLEHAGVLRALEVLPRRSEVRELRVVAPRATSDVHPRIELRGRWRGRGPLVGAGVRLEVHWSRARWDVAAAGPLPPWRMGAEAQTTLLETHTLELDAEGRAAVELGTPPAAGVVHLRAWPLDAPHDASARSFSWAPADLALRLEGPRAVPVQSRFHLDGSVASLGGVGRPNATLTLTLEGPESWTRDTRADTQGRVRHPVSLERPGSYRVTLSATDPQGREHRVTHELLAVAGPVDRAVSPSDGAGGLLRREGRELEVLAWEPGARGSALLEVDPQRPAQVIALEDGVLRARVTCPPGARVRVATLREGAVRWLELDEPLDPPPLEPVLTLGEGGAVHVTLRREGQAVVGRARLTALDGDAAAAAAHRSTLPWTADAGWTQALPEVGVPLEGTSVELPPAPPGLSWIRVVALTADGERGEAWLPRGEPPKLRIELAAPTHLVESDTAELSVELRGATPGLWRVSWEDEEVDLGQARVLRGAKIDPRRATGPQEVALDVDGDVLLVLPLRARRGSAAQARVRAVARSEDGAQSVEASAPIEVLQPGVWTPVAWSDFARPGVNASWTLAAPARAKAGRTRLEVAVSPDWATASLSALRALDEDPRPLASLWGLLPEETLRGACRTRRLTPPNWDPDRRQTLGALAPRLALAWREADGWGARNADVTLELVRLDRAGFAVPADLRRRGLAAIGSSTAPTALLARALAGELSGVTVPDPSETPADALAILARALHETGPPARARLVLAQALEARAHLSPRGLCALWQALRESGRAPPADLLSDALLGRRGAQWSDPATTGPAALALAQATASASEQPGERVRIFVEGNPIYEVWTGNGLAEWTPWLRRRGGMLRPGLQLEVESKLGPVNCAALFTTRIPRAQAGGTPVRRWFSRGGEPVHQVRYGEELLLELELERAPPGGLLEVPLPGGCRLAAPVPEAVERDGSLWLAPVRRRITLPLLAIAPGRYRVCPARWEPPGAAQGWSDVTRLEVVAPR